MRYSPVKRQLRRAAALMLCALLLAALLLPQAAMARHAEQKLVRVGWYDSPYNIKGANGRRSGYAYDYQQKITAYTNWTYEYVEGS